jgi:hypothetical protein
VSDIITILDIKIKKDILKMMRWLCSKGDLYYENAVHLDEIFKFHIIFNSFANQNMFEVVKEILDDMLGKHAEISLGRKSTYCGAYNGDHPWVTYGSNMLFRTEEDYMAAKLATAGYEYHLARFRND